MSAENRLTSIVSYPERGTGGNNRYRGNCSPKLIEDLIGFFKPAEICDYMCGSGTTQDAAHSMGIISHCYDLHSGFDLIIGHSSFSSGVSSFGLELIFETIIPVQVTTTTQRYIPIPNAHVR